tara:strand:+ start:1166 stop:1597 length:432 start_codon:yes stop_codon:yes gene_type:complete
MRQKPKNRNQFKYFQKISTRWSDNDVYGHVNNVIYYFWFDTAVNQFLIKNNTLDIKSGEIIGLVVETHCSYFSPISFPEEITVGLSVNNIGNSSVKYEAGIFKESDEIASAQGYFIHVYVNRNKYNPVRIPEKAYNLIKSIEN